MDLGKSLFEKDYKMEMKTIDAEHLISDDGDNKTDDDDGDNQTYDADGEQSDDGGGKQIDDGDNQTCNGKEMDDGNNQTYDADGELSDGGGGKRGVIDEGNISLLSFFV